MSENWKTYKQTHYAKLININNLPDLLKGDPLYFIIMNDSFQEFYSCSLYVLIVKFFSVIGKSFFLWVEFEQTMH